MADDQLPPAVHAALQARALRLFRTIEALWDDDRSVIPHLIYGLLVSTYLSGAQGTI